MLPSYWHSVQQCIHQHSLKSTGQDMHMSHHGIPSLNATAYVCDSSHWNYKLYLTNTSGMPGWTKTWHLITNSMPNLQEQACISFCHFIQLLLIFSQSIPSDTLTGSLIVQFVLVWYSWYFSMVLCTALSIHWMKIQVIFTQNRGGKEQHLYFRPENIAWSHSNPKWLT